MDLKNIKKRNVIDFDEFSKAYDEASKLVDLKKGQNAHPGAHAIKAEGLHYRNDANPYIAAGIPMDKPEDANKNDRNMAIQVDVYPKVHDGKDPVEPSELAKTVAIHASMNGYTATDAGTVSE